MIVLTVFFHAASLVWLSGLLDWIWEPANITPDRVNMMYVLGASVLVIIIMHSVEALIWAAVYYFVGEFTDISKALYFSVVTCTTLGYGDVTLSDRWRLLAGFEAMGGLILFGASIAFLLDVMRHLF
jgi:hypothetical protein